MIVKPQGSSDHVRLDGRGNEIQRDEVKRADVRVH